MHPGIKERLASADRPTPPKGWPLRWLILSVCFFLATAVWMVFGQTAHHAFVDFDDNTYIYENPMVQHGLTFAGLRWAFTTVHASNWHPLTWISHMTDCQFYGLHAGGHHLNNVLLHMANAILLFLVLRQLTGFLWRSAFVALVFAIHPLRVESVAWVAERKDVLSGLFFLLTIAAYVRYARRQWSWGGYGWVVAMLLLALLSKPMVVTLPLVLLLLDYWPLHRFPAPGQRLPGRLILEKLPLLALAAAVCVATMVAQQEALSSLPLAARLGNAVVSYAIYLGQMIYPIGLAPFYPHPEPGLALWKIGTATLLLLGLSAVAIARRQRQPWLLFGWLWYLGMLVPVIGILQVGLQAHADRYTYLPQIGLDIAIVWLVAEGSTGWRHRPLILGSGATVLLVALMLSARAQTAWWRDSESLWTQALACTADNTTARVNLGNALLQKGRVPEAVVQFQRALQLAEDPDARVSLGYALIQQGRLEEAMRQFQLALALKPHYAEAHNNLGDLLAQKGRGGEAITQFQTALQIKPDYPAAHYNLANALVQKGEPDAAIQQFQLALQCQPDYPEACYNLGNTFCQKREWARAIGSYQQALTLRPAYPNACYNLATALVQQGRLPAAITQLQTYLQLQPATPEAHYQLASLLVQDGQVAAAIREYRLALEFKPDYPAAQNDLAWELATAPPASVRNGPEAVVLAQRANQATGGADLDTIGTLAAAYAEAGQFAEAVRTVRHAIEVARNTRQTDQLGPLNAELKLYEAGQPCHQTGP